jgi:hypothetical protein
MELHGWSLTFMNELIVIRGTLFLWSETGTEGGYWALQDERFISPPTEDWPHESWSYDGLMVLKDGDHLKIFAPDGSIYWEGYIQLKHYPVFTEDANNFWIHADQSGIDRQFWATPFFKAYKGELVRGIKP